MSDLIEQTWILWAVACLTAYLAGSFSFARMMGRLFSGSGTLGPLKRKIPETDITLESDTMAATTASLQLGKPYGCLTAILDMTKVGLVVWLFLHFYPEDYAFLFAAMFGMVGHVYPVYHRFVGGRGQAPLLGGLLVINWFGVLIGNAAAVLLGYLTGSVLVMRWGWMVLMIGWFAIYFRDPWYVGYITLANMLFFYSMRKELKTARRILQSRTPTQEEVSEFMLMGKGLGRFIDRYGLPALLRKLLGEKDQ